MIIYNMILCFLEVLKYIFISDMFFLRQKRKFNNIILPVSLVCVAMGIVAEFNVVNYLILYTLFVFVQMAIIYENVNPKFMLLTLWSVFIITLLDEMTRVIIEVLMDYIKIGNHLIERFMSSLITVACLLSLSIIIGKKYRSRIEKVGIGYYIFFLGLTIANTFIIVFFKEYVFAQIQVDNVALVYVTFLAMSIGMFIEIALVMMLAVSRSDYKERNELNQKFLEEQKNHYKYLEERERETKLFRHDIRSHLNVIAEGLRKEKYDEVGKYIESICGQIENFGNVLTVNNGIVDAILNRYYSEAQKKNVSMCVKGQIPKNCKIEAFDLCTIFSNVLSNAIEAASKSENKSLEVKCGYKDNKIVIAVENDYDGNIKMKNGKYISNKNNTDYHGYGIINVKRSVEKYSRSMNIRAENKFIVNILMYNR